jgi:lysophospholipid acyltransferase (LPLAT)-like uncharacterized protein
MGILETGVAWWIRIVQRTARWSIEGAEHRAAIWDGPGGGIVAFWHERVGLSPLIWAHPDPDGRTPPKGTRVAAIISRHRDGTRIAQVAAQFGVEQIAGSARRGAMAAAREATKALAQGTHLAITPDGPRGPRRVMKPGLARMAARSGSPVLPAAVAARPRLILNSWDRFHLPLPFGRAALVFLPPIHVPKDADAGMLEAADAAIAAAMTEAAARADRLCGAEPTP